MVKKNIILLLLILLPILIFSQKIKISGIVYNQNKGIVSYTSVSQENTNNKVAANDRGEYELLVEKKDTIRIIFSSIGYTKIRKTILHATDNVVMNVFLKENIEAFDSVIVVGKVPQATTLQKIDVKHSKLLPDMAGGSIETLIVTLAGVSSTNELSTQYSVRGGNFDENSVYVNGIEVYRPLLIRSAQQEGLSFINPNMVETIGFSAGGYTAEYGDKMASVLDIVYKKPTLFEASISASLLGGGIYIGSASKKFTQITGVRYKTTQLLLATTDTNAEYKPSFIDAQTYMTYTFSPTWEAHLLANYSHNSYNFTPQTRSTTFGTLANIKNFDVYFKGWENDKFLTSQVALSLQANISNTLKIGIIGATFSSNEQEYYDIAGQYRLTDSNPNATTNSSSIGTLLGIGSYQEHARNKLDSRVFSLNQWGKWNIDKQQIKWGLTIQKEEITDKIKEWVMRDSLGYSLPNNGTTVNVFSKLKANNNINSQRYSAYLQDQYKYYTNRGLFILNMGARASYWDFNNELIISPRASLSYIPSGADYFTFRMAGGIYYQSPFYKEFQKIVEPNASSEVVLNKDIRSQKSVHYVLGSDFYFKSNNRPFKLTGELYYKQLSDIIPYTVNNVKIRYSGENMGKGHIKGVDMKLYGEFVPGIDSWLSVSLMQTQQQINGVTMPLPTDKLYNISIYFQDYFPGYERFKVSLKGLLSQGLPNAAPYKGYEDGYFRTPAYKRLDIGFSWLLLGEKFSIRKRNSFCKSFKNIWLGLDIFNLFDIKNTNSYYWVTDVYNTNYAVPNYLTTRQLNIKLVADF